MTIYEGWITGLVTPRPNTLLKMRDNSDNHIVLLDTERNEFIDIQRKTRLNYVSEPQLTWTDLTEPIKRLENVAIGIEIPLPSTHLFINKIIFKEKPVLENGVIRQFFPYGDRKADKFSIIGPYSLYHLSNAINNDRERIVNLLFNKILEEALSLGFKAIDLHEPFLLRDDKLDKWLLKRLYRIIYSYPSLDVFVYPYRQDTRAILDIIIDISRNGVLMYMDYTDLQGIIPLPTERLIIALSNILTEDDLLTFKRDISRFANRIRFRNITFTHIFHNTPYNDAVKSIRVLGLILNIVRGDYPR